MLRVILLSQCCLNMHNVNPSLIKWDEYFSAMYIKGECFKWDEYLNLKCINKTSYVMGVFTKDFK